MTRRRDLVENGDIFVDLDYTKDVDMCSVSGFVVRVQQMLNIRNDRSSSSLDTDGSCDISGGFRTRSD